MHQILWHHKAAKVMMILDISRQRIGEWKESEEKERRSDAVTGNGEEDEGAQRDKCKQRWD